jgi:hypothetical protein
MEMIKFFSFFCISFFLAASLSAQPGQNGPDPGTFTRISKHQDYGLTITRLVVDLGEGSAVMPKDLTEGSFEVSGSNKSDKVVRNIKEMSVTDRKGYIVTSGRYVTIDLDFGFDSDADNAYTYIVTLNKDLGKCGKGTKFVQKGRTLRR